MAISGVHVEIDPGSGFCPGVLRAIKLAEEALDKQAELFCVGDIVHNEMELSRLKDKGLQTIDAANLHDIQSSTVLFRAHGEPPVSYSLIREKGHQLIDASCPVVLRLQRQIRAAWEKGAFIAIYGKPDHPEVVALRAQTNNEALVIDKPESAFIDSLPEKLMLFSQTTRSVEGFYALAESLRKTGRQVILRDSICRRVSERIPGLRAFSRRFDKLVFVGGKNSANARLLYSICREEHPSAYFIGSVQELKNNWFAPGDTVGVTGATSTPPWLLQEVAAAIGNPKSKKQVRKKREQ